MDLDFEVHLNLDLDLDLDFEVQLGSDFGLDLDFEVQLGIGLWTLGPKKRTLVKPAAGGLDFCFGLGLRALHCLAHTAYIHISLSKPPSGGRTANRARNPKPDVLVAGGVGGGCVVVPASCALRVHAAQKPETPPVPAKTR
jgi:hypothetical protein